MASCFIGIQKIPNSANQYRLGTIFLRNFYTALDYDNNLILMGINKGSSERAKAYIDGKISNPYRSGGMTIGVVIVILLIAFAVAIIFYFKQHRQLKNSEGVKETFAADRARSASVAASGGAADDSLDENLVAETLDDDKDDQVLDKQWRNNQFWPFAQDTQYIINFDEY